ncbi:MAG TPA: ATPase, T2SS/T4P/T4SS family [Roseiflexaceae bacterium]|nr:ATPase, T2SS/T4P/T4SS family [Roseiflexaceae bacterium]
MTVADLASTTLSAAVIERLEELRLRQQSGRLCHWQRGVTETLQRAGLGEGYTLAEWAEMPWYGPLEQWRHPGSGVSDIIINGPERDIIVVERGNRTFTGVTLHPEWVQFVQRQLTMRAGFTTPQAPDDWRTPTGGVTHALIGSADRRLRFAVTRPPATPDGATVSIRILPDRWRTLDDLVHQESGIMPRQAAELLVAAVLGGATVLVAGDTGSGKTTLTAALLQAVGEHKRVIIIEDARELPPVADSISIEVLHSGMSFVECVRLTLRQRPDLIVCGEVRGPEALAMLQAAATGHPGICTIHAPDVQTALRNLERHAASSGEVPPQMVRGLMTSGAVPLVVCHVGVVNGRRTVTSIDEVITTGGCGNVGDRYTVNPLYGFNPASGRVEKHRSTVQGAWAKGRF